MIISLITFPLAHKISSYCIIFFHFYKLKMWSLSQLKKRIQDNEFIN